MKGNILVVDDEAVTLQSVGAILNLEGYDVQTANNGKLALELLQQGDFDLMLLDLKMPEMDGVEVMRATAQLARDLQIILLTGHGSMESAIEALHYKVHDYLIKPISPQVMLTSVASALKHRAELQHKRLLLNHMEDSIRQLKDTDKVDNVPITLSQVITITDGVIIDMARREIWRGDDHEGLTPTEAKLIKIFLDNRGQVLTHRELVFMVQGYDVADWEAPEVLRPLVSRLRRKLETFGGAKWIANVRGTGYVFDERGLKGKKIKV